MNKQWVYRTSRTVALLAAIFSGLLFFTAYLPLRHGLEQSLLENHRVLAEAKYQVLQGYVDRAVESAQSLASRTQIREALFHYLQGDISWEELKDFTEPRYQDGVDNLEQVQYAARLVVGDTRTLAGTLPPDVAKKEMFETAELQTWLDEERHSLHVVSPIWHAGHLLGYDWVQYDVQPVLQSIGEEPWDVRLLPEKEVDECREESDIVCFSMPMTSVIFSASVPRQYLMAPLQTVTRWAFLAAIIGLAGVTTIALRVTTRSATGMYALVEESRDALHREVHKARELHKAVLTESLPDTQRAQIAGFYEPVDALGGDSFSWYRSEGQLFLYITDVSGHGLAAALMSSFVKHTVDSLMAVLPKDQRSPGTILNHLGRQLPKKRFPEDSMITYWGAHLNEDTLLLRWAAAGFHTPPLLVCPGVPARELPSPGLPLSPGIDSQLLTIDEQEWALQPESMLVIATDGLLDQERQGTVYGRRLQEILPGVACYPAQAAVDWIAADFSEFLGASQADDDVTFLIVDTWPEETLTMEIPSTWRDFSEAMDSIRQWLGDHRGLESMEIDPSMFTEVAGELLANAMEHGHALDARKKVLVDIRVRSVCWSVTVTDHGPGFDWRTHLARTFHPLTDNERGRGVHLAARMPGTLIYNSKGNRVSYALPTKEFDRNA